MMVQYVRIIRKTRSGRSPSFLRVVRVKRWGFQDMAIELYMLYKNLSFIIFVQLTTYVRTYVQLFNQFNVLINVGGFETCIW